MYLKNKIKLISVICTACMLCGTAAEFSVRAENYGTADNYIIGEKGMACIKTVDEEGNYLDTHSDFELYNESEDQIGFWSGNERYAFCCTDPKNNVSNIRSGSVSIGIDDLPDILDNQETLYSYEIDSNQLKKEKRYNFEFGKTFDATVKYLFSGDDNTALVLPPNSFCVAVDAGWAQKKMDWWFGAFDNRNYEDYNIHFRDLAGKQQIISMPDGDYPYCLGYTFGNSRGSNGDIFNRNNVSDQSSEYALKRIKLSEIYPSYFNSNGTHTHDFFGKIYNYNFGIDDEANGISACMIFISGDVITAPIPDAQGYVNIYVDKSTNEFSLTTNYVAGSASGGGTTGSPGYPYRVKKFSFSTPSVPDKGIILSGMDDGQYTVKASHLPDEYEADDAVFTVGPTCDGVPVCTLTAKRKRYAVNVSQSQHGAIFLTDDITQAIKGQKISLFAVPDKGYICKECRVTDKSGKDFDLDKELLNNEGVFYMPGEAAFIQGIFGVNFGDVNLDNRIDADDLDILHIRLLLDHTSDLPVTADMNSNGKVDIFDQIRLMRKLDSNDTEQ